MAYVADRVLSSDLATAATNSIEVQFALSQVSAITEGTIVLLGDTLKLQTETLPNPQTSTFTMNLRYEGGVVGAVDYILIVLRIPQQNVFYSRVFTWNSQDNPAQIITKWNNTMRPFSNGISFGHLSLTYDSGTSKFSGVFDQSTDYGAAEGFGWFSKNDGTDPAKDNLGLHRSPSGANPNWAAGMTPRAFPFTAGFLQQVVKVGLFVTGSNGATPRQMDFDITSYVANNSATSSEKYTMIVNHSNEVSFFAGETEITRDAEVGGAYIGAIVPTRFLNVLSNSSQDIVLDDFDKKSIQSSKTGNAYFQGLYGKTANGTTLNIVNSIERIEDKLYVLPESINIVSCTATADSWLLTTDNAGGDVQLNVTSAYNPVAARTLTRESPTFTDNNTIETSSDWNSSTMFTIVSSSALTGGSGHEPHRAFNRDTSTFWASGAGTYNVGGAGQQFITVVYPQAVELRSHRINAGTLLNSGTSAPIQWSISGSNSGNLFTVVDTFSTSAWVDNVSQTFIMHNQTAFYKFWRITVTRVTSTGSTTYAILPSVIFDTGIGDTRYMDENGSAMSMINSNYTWPFYIIILKGSEIVCSGLYRLSTTGFIKLDGYPRSLLMNITTDNTSGELQCFVSPSYTLASVDVFTKDSPTFINNISIQSSQDWNNADKWRLVTSSTFQNNPLFAANAAFDKRVDTWWGSSEGSTRYPGTTAPTQWTIQASNDTNFVVIESFSKNNWVANQSVAFPITVSHEPYRFLRLAVTQAGSDAVMGNGVGRTLSMIGSPLIAWDFTIMLTKNGCLVNTADLARASYLPLNEAEKFVETLGFTLDRQLSREDTMVVVDIRGQPTIIHRGSVTPRDWLVDDVLIAAGSSHETQRLRRARQVTVAAEAKYKTKKSNAVGHTLGGRLAELAGSGGEIVTFNRAAGLGDLGLGRNQPSRNGSRQTNVRTKMDAVSALSTLNRRQAVNQPPTVVVRQRDQANRFLPGPVRFLVNAVKAHSLKNLK
ncbi:hypothetical protein T492DRAFT_848175 [Pavlovales sp. CCMP2436]|nr:hypothetical protein T492DRAFT_848175 [Pavlovales sp. CCMP2436]